MDYHDPGTTIACGGGCPHLGQHPAVSGRDVLVGQGQPAQPVLHVHVDTCPRRKDASLEDRIQRDAMQVDQTG